MRTIAVTLKGDNRGRITIRRDYRLAYSRTSHVTVRSAANIMKNILGHKLYTYVRARDIFRHLDLTRSSQIIRFTNLSRSATEHLRHHSIFIGTIESVF